MATAIKREFDVMTENRLKELTFKAQDLAAQDMPEIAYIARSLEARLTRYRSGEY